MRTLSPRTTATRLAQPLLASVFILYAAGFVCSQQPQPAPSSPSVGQTNNLLELDEAVRLASTQASAFQQARLNESIASQDVLQARVAFLPRVAGALDYVYNTPVLHARAGEARTPSFIAANSIGEYQGLVTVAGDVDISGRLGATFRRASALLAAAHAGAEVARRELKQATIEAYYSLALATARRRSTEQGLAAAEEFERVTNLLLSGGEVAPVDLTRAQLQITQRRDDLERAKADETVAAGALRVLIGYDFAKPIVTVDLSALVPLDGEIENITVEAISQRPEFAQFEAERRVAEQEVKIARAERRPQLSYTISGGVDTNSLRSPAVREHTGLSGLFSLSIPIFDFGASKSRERQARLRQDILESQHALGQKGFYQHFYAARAAATSAATRIKLAGAGLSQAQSNLDASVARYRAGEASIIEVTDALTGLATQRLALYQAIFDFQTARARLLQASGR